MKILKYMDKWLLLISTILFAIGLVMVFSASNVASFMRYKVSPYHFIIRQSAVLFLGVLLSITLVYMLLASPPIRLFQNIRSRISIFYYNYIYHTCFQLHCFNHYTRSNPTCKLLVSHKIH